MIIWIAHGVVAKLLFTHLFDIFFKFLFLDWFLKLVMLHLISLITRIPVKTGYFNRMIDSQILDWFLNSIQRYSFIVFIFFYLLNPCRDK